MDFLDYYKFWLESNPTPEVARLYTEKRHGFLLPDDQWDASKFLGTMMYAMHLAHDREHEVFRQVLFFCPKQLEPQILKGFQTILNCLKGKLLNSKAACRPQLRQHILGSVANINVGSRVYTLKGPPPYWVSYGFQEGSSMPEWLQEGLI